MNKRSSAKSHLQGLCDALEYWAEIFQCDVRAAWIPGRLNTLADSLSREKCAVHSADYQLLQSEFDRWDKRFGPHEVDAFADDVGSNAFCKKFWSAQDDALAQDWTGKNVWCNPDFGLAGQALQKFLDSKRECWQGTTATFVLPYLKGQWWWAMARKGDLVHTYPKGSLLFSTVPAWHDETADIPPIWSEIPRRVIGPTPWPVVVIRFE